ncbi:MAG: short-chain dehydrogenase [Chloroflexi bacterium]|nr:MAG: short-chain dehydrogenase [Chloroflexota bacterium]
MRLQGKVAIVTGAASGIGRATALRFAQEGARVVVADINTAGAAACAELIHQQGGTATFIATDVASEADIQAMIQTAVTLYGGLDILHNNAYWTEARTALETTLDNWQRTIDVTLRAVWLAAKAATPHLQARGGGVILNTASVHSVVGVPGYAAYQAAKGGVLSLTRALALELAPRIRVVAILPGAIDTPAVRISSDLTVDKLIQDIPLQRLGKPEEIAATAAFLASDEAAYITGTGIVVDGGYTTP